VRSGKNRGKFIQQSAPGLGLSGKSNRIAPVLHFFTAQCSEYRENLYNDLSDFLSAARYWETPKKFGLTIESHREVSLEPRQIPDLDMKEYKLRITGVPLVDARVLS
jgi:hypothetical protein